MKPTIYVLDTHSVVWFLKGLKTELGRNAFEVMSRNRARIVVPAYVLQEAHWKFARRGKKPNSEINIPPTALLRVLLKCSNTRIISRGAPVLAQEFRLTLTLGRSKPLDPQDIPIAAVALVVRAHHDGIVALITKDPKLTDWAKANGIPALWNQFPFQHLPS